VTSSSNSDLKRAFYLGMLGLPATDSNDLAYYENLFFSQYPNGLNATYARPSGGSAWVTSTAYTVGAVVTQGGVTYMCATAHTSGTFATDLAAAKWVATSAATTSGAGPGLYPSGYYYEINGGNTNVTANNNNEFCFPLFVGQTVTLDRLSIQVTSAGSTGSVIRLGIRSDSGHGFPGAVLLDSGTVSSTSTGVKEQTISQQLTPGLWWVTATGQGLPSTLPNLRGASPSVPISMAGWSSSIADPTQQPSGYAGTSSGALGAFSYSSTTGSSGTPTFWVRFA
jgi:hypothetical protein